MIEFETQIQKMIFKRLSKYNLIGTTTYINIKNMKKGENDRDEQRLSSEQS